MQLLIIRHADAGDAHEFAKTGKPDSKRPLTDKGQAQMRDAMKGILKLVPKIDFLASSPYIRALQTAEIVLAAYEKETAREVTNTLEPEEDPDAFLKWLRGQGRREVVAAVGHEPNLSTLATWLIAGLTDSRLEMKKAGACLIEFAKYPAKGDGTLLWLMGPKQLRA